MGVTLDFTSDPNSVQSHQLQLFHAGDIQECLPTSWKNPTKILNWVEDMKNSILETTNQLRWSTKQDGGSKKQRAPNKAATVVDSPFPAVLLREIRLNPESMMGTQPIQ